MTPETGYVLLAVILVLYLAGATAKAASEKGGNATHWFIAGCLLPGLALVVALFLDERLLKECPRCVRRVDRDSRVCSYCGHDFANHGNLRVG